MHSSTLSDCERGVCTNEDSLEETSATSPKYNMNLENNMHVFTFSYGGGVIAITTLYLLLIAGVSIPFLGDDGVRVIYKILIMAVLVIPILVCAIVAPVKLTVDDRAIVLHQVAHSITIPLEEVTRATVISSKMLDGSIRTFGSGGLMGYLGKFRNRALGNYTMYASSWKNHILIQTTTKTYVFTPDNPQKAIEAINKQIP